MNIILESTEIQDIMKKIEEIENILEQEDILPKELKITAKEFKDACIKKDKRLALLIKIDTALDFVSDQVR
jgi:hypothetical protein